MTMYLLVINWLYKIRTASLLHNVIILRCIIVNEIIEKTEWKSEVRVMEEQMIKQKHMLKQASLQDDTQIQQVPATQVSQILGSEKTVVERASLKNNDFKFNFRLPECGLSLRSATFLNGVPEFWFDAHPKVPTITEEDVGTIFRLVFEGFCYASLPPFHVSRMYTL